MRRTSAATSTSAAGSLLRVLPRGTHQIVLAGQPNVGKSSFINRLLGENRLVTGPEAGITRDSIAIDWVWHDPNPSDPELAERRIRLIDTAGMRKRARVQEKLEKLSVADTRRAIDFAEVVVLTLDATRGLEHGETAGLGGGWATDAARQRDHQRADRHRVQVGVLVLALDPHQADQRRLLQVRDFLIPRDPIKREKFLHPRRKSTPQRSAKMRASSARCRSR